MQWNSSTTEDKREAMDEVEALCYRYLFKYGVATNCTFIVGPVGGTTREIKAHREYVAAANVVFANMLLWGKMTKTQPAHVRIRVTDLSPDTFQQLLNFIYGMEPKMNSFGDARMLAHAANKYQMKALLQMCVTQMIALITPKNVWAVMKTVKEARLKEVCVQLLRRDTLRCLTDPGFLHANEETVALLLKQDELSVAELTLVNFAVHWARHAARQRGLSTDDSGVRAVLTPRLLALFRLQALSLEQFLAGPGLAGWLIADEKIAVAEFLRSREKWPKQLSSLQTRKL